MKKLNSKELSILKKHFTPLRINNSCNLVYEKQIPNMAIVLLDGELELISRNKPAEKISPGSLMGVHQLINNEPVKQGCKIRENSEIIILQKSDLLEVSQDDNSELFPILN